LACHSLEGGNLSEILPALLWDWIPAFAGMTNPVPLS
jgi:hypothetical protein